MFRFYLLTISFAVAVFFQPSIGQKKKDRSHEAQDWLSGTGDYAPKEPEEAKPPTNYDNNQQPSYVVPNSNPIQHDQQNLGYQIQNPIPYNYGQPSPGNQYYSNGGPDLNTGYGSSGVNNPMISNGGYNQQNSPFISQTGNNGNPGQGSSGGYNSNSQFVPNAANDPRQQQVNGGQGSIGGYNSNSQFVPNAANDPRQQQVNGGQGLIGGYNSNSQFVPNAANDPRQQQVNGGQGLIGGYNQNPQFIPNAASDPRQQQVNPGQDSSGGYNPNQFVPNAVNDPRQQQVNGGQGLIGGYNQNPQFIPNAASDPRQQQVNGGQGQGFVNPGGYQLPPQHSGYGGTGSGNAAQSQPGWYTDGQRQHQGFNGYAEEQEQRQFQEAQRDREMAKQPIFDDYDPPASFMSDNGRGFDGPRRNKKKKPNYEDSTSIGNFNRFLERRNNTILCIIWFIVTCLHMIL